MELLMDGLQVVANHEYSPPPIGRLRDFGSEITKNIPPPNSHKIRNFLWKTWGLQI